MKLAVITDEIDNDLARALDVMAEYDIYNAELRAIGGGSISLMTTEEIYGVKRILDAKAACAIGIASPFYKTDLPGTGTGGAGPLHGGASLAFEEQMVLLEHLIEAAAILEAPLIRTFAFWKHGPLTPEIEDRIVEAYREPARRAVDAGVMLVLENEPSCYIGSGAEAARIVARIDSPAVRIVWDPGNAVFAGEKPFPDGYEAVKPYLAHVHVKDAALNAKGVVDCVAVGEGAVGWPEQIRALHSDGYRGYLSLETHANGPENKEASSRKCLDALTRMVKSLY